MRVWIWVIVAMFWAVAAVAEDRATALARGEQMYVAGDLAGAAAVAASLAAEAPDDPRVLLLQAATDIAEGRGDARASAAWRAARTDAERVTAARVIASAYSRRGRYLRAQLWLRRAIEAAPDPATEVALGAALRQARDQSPLSVTLNFTAAPSSNVNNGSSSSVTYLFDIPFILSDDARALSGFELAFGADVRWRLTQSDRQITTIGSYVYGRTYALSGAARTAAPDARGSDYALAVAEVFVNHSQLFAPDIGPTEFELRLGQQWYGGDVLARYVTATTAQTFRLNRTNALTVEALVQSQRDGDDAFSRKVGLITRLETLLPNRDGLALGLGAEKTISSVSSLENRNLRAEIYYGLARPILGARFSFGLVAEYRDYPVSPYALDGRRDTTISAHATAVLDGMSFYGFAPTIGIELARTRSNVALYDREGASLRFGLKSSF